MNNDTHTSFSCDITAIPAANRQQHLATMREVFGAVQAVQELPNGYAFRLSNANGLLMKAAEFIDNERRCCPFFSFTVEVEPAGGPIWLRLTGHNGVKPFIQAEIGEALNEAVAQAANFR